MKFVRIVLDKCCNKPLMIVDRDPQCPYALKKIGLEYVYERFGRRNIVERPFGYLKQRNINNWRIQPIEDYASTIAIIRKLHTTIRTQGGVLLGGRGRVEVLNC